MVTAAVGDVPEAVEGRRFADGVVSVQGESGQAVLTGSVIVAKAGGVPAYRVEGLGFPHRLVEASDEVLRAVGVFQCAAVVPALFPGSCQHVVGAGPVG